MLPTEKLLLGESTEQSEHLQEQSDDVDVQDHRCKHVVIDRELVGVTTEDQLGVVDDEHTQQHHAQQCYHDVQEVGLDEQEEQTAKQQAERQHKHESSQLSVVVFGLDGIHSESKNHSSSQDTSSKNYLWFELDCGETCQV